MTQEKIHETAFNLYEKMLPSMIKKFGRKYLLIDRTNSIDDFKNFFFIVVLESVMLYRKSHVSKNPVITTKWKHKNGKSQFHKMKIETFVIEQLKKRLDESTKNLNVKVENGNYEKEMSYQSFIKKRAYYKAGNFKVAFIRPEISFSEMHKENSDLDDENFDPENYREGLSDEIHDLLFSDNNDDDDSYDQ